jgi:dTDP-4-amino-4,6-dideoxygalactose transaminase
MTEKDRIPLMNLAWQWSAIRDEALGEIERLFEESAFCLGPWVDAFEHDFASYINVRHAIGVASGSAAIHVAALAAGLKAGDKVLVPAQTFIGTIWGFLYHGIEPVLCDVSADTATLDPHELARRMQPNVKAIVPVHLFGQPADMEKIMVFARERGLIVIEDVAQAVGAVSGGRKLGAIGGLGCFSFYPGKNLGAAGEAGMVTTDCDSVADRIRALRNHGQFERYVHREIGYNYRMDGLQALVLARKLKFLDGWTDERRRLADIYLQELVGLPLALPVTARGDHVWHLFVIRSPARNALRHYLDEAGIDTGLHYPIPLHRQPCLAHFEIDRESFPQADAWANEALSLPIFPGMTQAQQTRVISTIHEFFRQI